MTSQGDGAAAGRDRLQRASDRSDHRIRDAQGEVKRYTKAVRPQGEGRDAMAKLIEGGWR